MTIIIVAALSSNSALGNKGQLLFNIKEDLKNFQKISKGNTVVFGRRSFEEIVHIHGKGLSGRVNVVLTRDENYKAYHGEFVFNSIEKIINHHKTNGDSDKEIIVCGGEKVYEEFIPFANEAIITHINKHVEEADTFFPIELLNEYFTIAEESEEFYSEKYDAYYKFTKYVRKGEEE